MDSLLRCWWDSARHSTSLKRVLRAMEGWAGSSVMFNSGVDDLLFLFENGGFFRLIWDFDNLGESSAIQGIDHWPFTCSNSCTCSPTHFPRRSLTSHWLVNASCGGIP
ncbi:hypothetical protein EYF80_035256 [Liparis tanakae]|uniref:Uncharacterized protein n=1 Tax=Liparis tanakae TaxID=230148 RepID=A0A4Z2GP13_9TELE|nr:hypothetical protein EYF80_035256 [Liparis tanakae]